MSADIEALRALSDAATSGRWQQGIESNRGLTATYDEAGKGIALHFFNSGCDRPYDQRVADAKFSAAAVNFVRDNLAELTRLRANAARAERMEERAAVLESLSRALIAKLDAIAPKIASDAAFMQMRGFVYDGPTFGEELESLKAALKGKP